MSWGCYVYVIGPDHGKAVKIGIAADPHQRVKQLQTGSPDALRVHRRWGPMSRAAASQVEAGAHFIAAGFRLEGEWFAMNPEMATLAVWTGAESRHLGFDMPQEQDRFLEFVRGVGVV